MENKIIGSTRNDNNAQKRFIGLTYEEAKIAFQSQLNQFYTDFFTKYKQLELESQTKKKGEFFKDTIAFINKNFYHGLHGLIYTYFEFLKVAGQFGTSAGVVLSPLKDVNLNKGIDASNVNALKEVVNEIKKQIASTWYDLNESFQATTNSWASSVVRALGDEKRANEIEQETYLAMHDYLNKRLKIHGMEVENYKVFNEPDENGIKMPKKFAEYSEDEKKDFLSKLEGNKTILENIDRPTQIKNEIDKETYRKIDNFFNDYVDKSLYKIALNSANDQRFAEKYPTPTKAQQFFYSSFESIGSILSIWTMAGILGDLGASAEVIKISTASAFAAHVYAGAVTEALDNGAPIQDAHIYGLTHAITETIAEEMLGFDLSGVQRNRLLGRLLKFMSETQLGQVIGSMFEEGIEEIFGEISTRSADIYANKEFEPLSPREFWQDIGLAFAGGAFSSAILGGVQSLTQSGLVERRLMKYAETLNMQATIEGAENRLRRLQDIVDILNSESQAKWIKNNAVQKMSLEDKFEFLINAELEHLIEFKDGSFRFKYAFENNPSLLFDNYIDGQKINNNEYAINDNVKGFKFEKNNLNPLKVNQLNENGHKILEISQELNVPIAIYGENADTTGRLDHKNGIIFINQNAFENQTETAIRNEVTKLIPKHEMWHKIQMFYPYLADDLIEEITKNIDVVYENGRPIFRYNNNYVKNYFQSNGIEKVLADYYSSSYNNKLAKLKDNGIGESLAKNIATTKALNVVFEEASAYLFEQIVDGNAFYKVISKEGKKKLTRGINDAIIETQKEKSLKKLSKKYLEALNLVVNYENTIGFLVEKFNVNSVSGLKTIFTPRFDKLSEQELEDIIIQAVTTYNEEKGTVIINGEELELREVFNDNITTDNSDKMRKQIEDDVNVAAKNTEINVELEKSKDKDSVFKKYLKGFEDFNSYVDFMLEELTERSEEWQTYNKMSDIVQDIIYNLEDGIAEFNANEAEVIEIFLDNYAYDNETKNWYRKDNAYNVIPNNVRAMNNALTLLYRHLSAFNSDIYKFTRYFNSRDILESVIYTIAKYDKNTTKQNIEAGNKFFAQTVNLYFGTLFLNKKNKVPQVEIKSLGINEIKDTKLKRSIELNEEKFNLKKGELYVVHLVHFNEDWFNNEIELIENKRKLENAEFYDTEGNLLTDREIKKVGVDVIRDKNNNVILFFEDGKTKGERKIGDLGTILTQKKTKFSISGYAKAKNILELPYNLDKTNLTVEQKEAIINDYYSTIVETSEKLKTSKIRDKNGKLIPVFHGTFKIFNEFKKGLGYYWFSNSSWNALSYTRSKNKNNIFLTYLMSENPYIIDAEGANWMGVLFEGQKLETDEIVEIIKKRGGYDSVWFKNVIDYGDEVYGFEKPHDVFVVFNENQIVPVSRGENVIYQNDLEAIRQTEQYDAVTRYNEKGEKETILLDRDNFVVKENNLFKPKFQNDVIQDIKHAVENRFSNSIIKIPFKDYNLIKANELNSIQYNERNMLFDVLPYDYEKAIETINNSFEKVGITAVAVPIVLHGSFNEQIKINDNLKLIYSEPVGTVNVKTEHTYQNLKYAIQIWVEDSNPLYKMFKDMRLFEKKAITHDDFSIGFIDGSPASLEKAKKIKFDFAVAKRGVGNFNDLIYKAEDLEPKKRYYLIKINEEFDTTERIRIFEKFKSIDYNELAFRGTDKYIGFTSYDLIEEFKRDFQEPFEKDPARKKLFKETTPLNESEIKNIKEIFTEEFAETFADSVRKDKNGKFVITNESFNRAKNIKQEFTLNNIHFTEEDAISIKNANVHKIPITTQAVVNMEKVKIADLTHEQFIGYQFLKGTNLSFVVVNFLDVNDKNVAGKFLFGNDASVVLISKKHLTNRNSILELVIHEHAHAIYDSDPKALHEMLPYYQKLLFDVDNDGNVSKSTIYKYIEQIKYNDFIKYLNKYYSQLFNIKDLSEFYNLFDEMGMRDKGKKYSDTTELLAQITGNLFNNIDGYFKVAGGMDSFDNLILTIPILEFFNKMVYNSRLTANERSLYNTVLNKVKGVYENHNEKLKKLFPPDYVYKVSDLNGFINEFTNGEYKTLKSLITKLMEENKNNRYGEARDIINKIVYLASSVPEVLQESIESARSIKKHFTTMFDFIENLIDNPSLISEYTNPEIAEKIKKLVELVQVSKDPELKMDVIKEFENNPVGLEKHILKEDNPFRLLKPNDDKANQKNYDIIQSDIFQDNNGVLITTVKYGKETFNFYRSSNSMWYPFLTIRNGEIVNPFLLKRGNYLNSKTLDLFGELLRLNYLETDIVKQLDENAIKEFNNGFSDDSAQPTRKVIQAKNEQILMNKIDNMREQLKDDYVNDRLLFNYSFEFNSTDWRVKFFQTLREFGDAYYRVFEATEEKRMFASLLGLPNADAVNGVNSSILALYNIFKNNPEKITKNYILKIFKFYNDFYKTLIGNINEFSNSFINLKVAHEIHEKRTLIIESFISEMQKSLKRVEEKWNDKKLTLSEKEKNTFSKIAEIIELFKNNKLDIDSKKTEILKSVDELLFSIENDSELDETMRANYTKDFSRHVYFNLALLFNDDQIIFDRFESADIIEKIKENSLKSIYKNFKTSSFAKMIVERTFKMVNFKMESAISPYGEIVSDSAIRYQEDFRNFQKTDTKISIPHASHSSLIQTTLDSYVNATKGLVPFFKELRDSYYEHVEKMEMVQLRGLRKLKDFYDRNPDLIEHSKTEVEVSTDALIKINLELWNELDRLHKKEVESAKVEYTSEKNKVEVLEKRKKVLIQELIELKNNAQQNKKRMLDIKQELIGIRENIKIEKKALDKAKLNLNLIKNKGLSEKVIEYKNKKENILKLKRSELALIYMTVVRELDNKRKFGIIDEVNFTQHMRENNIGHVVSDSLIERKGFKEASKVSNLTTFLITAESIENLEFSLRQLLTPEDYKIIEFTYEILDEIYVALSDTYEKLYGAPLPKELFYVMMRTLESDTMRDLEHIVRFNLEPRTSMTKALTLGASKPLMFQGIFTALTYHLDVASKYMLTPFIKTWQGIIAAQPDGKNTIKMYLESGTFGKNNNFIDMVDRKIRTILNYSDLDDMAWLKTYRQLLRTGVASAVGSPFVFAKQFISTYVIAIKRNLNPFALMKDTFGAFFNQYKDYHEYMKENIPNFALREFAGLPKVAENPAERLNVFRNRWKQFNDKILTPLQYADAKVLVGAFVTIAKKIEKEQRKAGTYTTQENVFKEAKKVLDEVLKHDVANTSAAYMMEGSVSKNPFLINIFKLNSENGMHLNALVKGLNSVMNKVPHGWEELLSALAAFILSGFMSAVIDSGRKYLDQRIDPDDFVFEFLTNDFIWGNLVGGLPVVNLFSQMLQWDIDKVVKINMPRDFVLSDIADTLKLLLTLPNSENPYGIALKLVEKIGRFTGTPVRGFTAIASIISKQLAGGGGEISNTLSRIFKGQTRTLVLNDAIRNGKEKQLNLYINNVYETGQVAREITRLSLLMPDKPIKIYDVDYFRKQDENGKMIKYEIPKEVKIKFQKFANDALLMLIKSSKYKKLSTEEKIKVIQRVINYYYNFMKDLILEEVSVKAMLKKHEVVNNALSYSKTEAEKKQASKKPVF